MKLTAYTKVYVLQWLYSDFTVSHSCSLFFSQDRCLYYVQFVYKCSKLVMHGLGRIILLCANMAVFSLAKIVSDKYVSAAEPVALLA